MHTEETKNNPTGDRSKRMGKPGQQVAVNRTFHCDMQMVENGEGEYDCVVTRTEYPALIRGEYYPIGKNFHYPKAWGRKWAATKLLEYIMADKRKQIEDAQRELEKLQRCQDKVDLWSDTDK